MAGRGGRQPTTAAWRARRVARHGSAARGTSGDETRGDGAAMRSGVGSASRVGAMPAERALRRVVVAGRGAAAAAPVATAAAPSLTKRSVKYESCICETAEGAIAAGSPAVAALASSRSAAPWSGLGLGLGLGLG